MYLVCTLFLLLSLPLPSLSQNNFPLILVHGFAGWGPTELLGFPYFGGLEGNGVNFFQGQGYQVFAVAVGPVSSSWDRACELYAQIKGGTVDYGHAHSSQYGHARYGRTYPGFFPQWGTLDSHGNVQKVHLVAHSQGGQDSRILTALLNNGNAAEINAGGSVSPLFQGNHPWIASVTTLGSPHDGTSLATDLVQFIPFLKNLLVAVAGFAGTSTNNWLYDFMLDQWGLQRNPGESWSSYSNRVFSSNIWSNTQDISSWTLTPDGAQQINRWAVADPRVFYLTWGADTTYTGLWGWAYADVWTILPLQVTAAFMGSYTRNDGVHVTIDSSWFHNDGIVNTRSHAGPTLGSSDVIESVSPGNSGTYTLQAGIFNFYGILGGWDHFGLVGDNLVENCFSTFQRIANILKNLPPNVSSGGTWNTNFIDIVGNATSTPTYNFPPLNCAQGRMDYNNYCNQTLAVNTTACIDLAKNLAACGPNSIVVPENKSSRLAIGFISVILTLFCLYF